MSFVTAAPEMLATAAQNVANIGTSLSAANATAAASTTSVLAEPTRYRRLSQGCSVITPRTISR